VHAYGLRRTCAKSCVTANNSTLHTTPYCPSPICLPNLRSSKLTVANMVMSKSSLKRCTVQLPGAGPVGCGAGAGAVIGCRGCENSTRSALGEAIFFMGRRRDKLH
jgi:hypothetical protein